MPEQPEVERAVVALRSALIGCRIANVTLLHPALRRGLGERALVSLRGRVADVVERRGKHQFVRLDDGRTMNVHFRMAGNWVFDTTADEPPRHARALIDCTDGSRIVLVDPRALATISLLDADAPPPSLGPEADDPLLTPQRLRVSLARRRGPIKPVMLDQRIVAGVGNIYAAEALWQARISPRAPAASLGPERVARLLDGIRVALREGARDDAARYGEAPADDRFAVYGRAGEPCRRCGSRIRRITQAGRSTYYCPRCQAR